MMTTFKIDQPAHPLHNREFPEYTAFARYNGAVEYVPLLIGVNQVRFFAACNLKAIKEPFDSGLDYIYPLPSFLQTMSDMAARQLEQDIAAARELWRKIQFVPGAPIVRLEPDDLMSVNDSRNVTVIPARAA